MKASGTVSCTGTAREKPLHLVLRVRDHGWLPLAVGVVVPVFWLVCIGVRDVFRLVPLLLAAGSHKSGSVETVHWSQLLHTLPLRA